MERKEICWGLVRKGENMGNEVNKKLEKIARLCVLGVAINFIIFGFLFDFGIAGGIVPISYCLIGITTAVMGTSENTTKEKRK